MKASRGLLFSAVVLAMASPAVAAGTPALVVDVDTGKVLYAERATDLWYPASITKLMTAYVALSAVRDGQVAMDTLLTVTEQAAAQPPSKMGFRPGTQVRLDNALKIIMVKSANDVSTTIAEGLAGSVDAFAQIMNDTAWRLGMRESRWSNPHGLPDPAQYTSARDMAILGRALLRDFPDHSDLFQLSAIQLGRRVMANHNGLIGRYPGADGMKTGFICSSGFNVVASATQNGRRLITVVMGSPSAAERTHRAADLFDRGFASYGWGRQTLMDLPRSSASGPPDMRPVICGGRGPVPAEEDAQPAAIEANASGNADNPITALVAPAFSALAFAGGSVATPRRALGPRAPLQPVLVWTGASPNTAVAEDEREEKPVRRGKGRAKVAAKSRASVVAAVTTPLKAPPSIIAEGGAKGAIAPAAALASTPKPKLGAAPAKAKPKADAKTDRKSDPPPRTAAASLKPEKPEKKPAPKATAKQADAKVARAKKPDAKTAPATKPDAKVAQAKPKAKTAKKAD